MTTIATGAGATTTKTDAMAPATGQASTAKSSLGTNFNTFLNMLTTQLKHQDPLSPMDSTQFTNQLVQFSSVEQQINANSNLQTLIKLQQTNQASQSMPYLGQTVEVTGSDLPLQGGASAFSYTLGATATNISASIVDSKGVSVATITADPAAGRHMLNWDGNDSSGTQLPDGKYSVVMAATDADGKPVSTTTTTYGKVTKILSDPTAGSQLVMGGSTGGDVIATLDKIVSVNDAGTGLQDAQLQAANAQYQAAQAQYQAAEAALKAQTTTTPPAAK